jgi:hypothetical protein
MKSIIGMDCGAINKDVLKELKESANDMLLNVVAGTIDPDKVITFLKLEQQMAEMDKQSAKEIQAEINYIMEKSEKEYYNTLYRQWEKTKKQPPELEKIYNREKELGESRINCDSYIMQIENVIYAINKISGNRQLQPSEITVMAYYPQFKNDIETLIKNNVIKRTENGMKWEYSKQSLAEYFYSLQHNGRHNWKIIELLFDVNGLKNSISTNGDSCKKKSSDYEKILNLLNTPKSK